MEAFLFVLQRYTALVMAPLVILHLIVILIAVEGGLTAGEIRARTEGNLLWAAFYSAFVVAAALHAPIGLRKVLKEWTPLGRAVIDGTMLLFCLLLLYLGLRAVVAVIWGWS